MKMNEAMVRGRWRYLLVGWAVLETMLFGGLINGWASLVFVLKEDGIYSHLCDLSSSSSSSTFSSNSTGMTTMVLLPQTEESQVSCTAQDGTLNLWFTIAAALRNTYGVVVGIHIFKFGTRSTRLTGWFFFCIGALMMAFADESNSWMILPSLMALSYGGVTLLLTNVQISCLFPRAASVIVTLISGAFDFSASTQMVVKTLHELELVSRMYSFVGLACLHSVMVLISTLCFLPKDILASQADDQTPQLPPQPSVTRRRDSMYDWSVINMHSRQHKFSCSVCEDSSSFGEQRDHLAANHVVDSGTSERDRHLPEGHPNENQCTYQQGFTTLSDDCSGNVSQQGTRSSISGQSESSWSFDNPVSDPPTANHNKRAFVKKDSKVSNNNGISHVFTISGMRRTEPPSISTSNQGRKFISIIQIGHPQNRLWRREASSLWQQKTFATRTETVHFSETVQPLEIDDNLEARTSENHEVMSNHEPQSYRLEAASDNFSAEERTVSETRTEENEREEEGDLFPTLRSCLCSAVFWLHVMWFSFNVLRLVAFFGLINTKLTRMFNGDKDKVSFFTNVQAYFVMAVLTICWMSGALYDWLTSFMKERKKAFQRQVLPAALPLALTSLLGVAFSACWMIDSEEALYVMFALLVFYNAFIYGLCMSFILRIFPEHYFGILNGVVAIIAGGICFLQYAIFIWYDDYSSGTLHADIFMLSLVLLSFLHPIYIVFKAMV